MSNSTAFIEVTDPASPALVDVVPHGESCCSDSRVYRRAIPTPPLPTKAGFSDDRSYVYLNDELDERDFGTVTSTHVIDVRDLSDPKFVLAFSSGTPSTDHNLMVKGDFVYEANYRTGLRIFYVPSPNFAEEVGFFDTHPASDAAGFNGAWGIYPHLPRGAIIVSDIENGLFIFDLTGAIQFVENTVESEKRENQRGITIRPLFIGVQICSRT